MSARSTSLKDAENGSVARVDEISEHIGFIDVVHHRVHEGRMFTGIVSDLALASAASLELLIRPPVGTFTHTRVRTLLGGDANIITSEGATFSAAGTVVTPVNRNRVTLGGGPNVAKTLLTSGPTITDPGTTLFNVNVPGGSGFFSSGGGEGNNFFEVILDPGAVYLLSLTNTSGGVQPATLIMDFYENL